MKILKSIYIPLMLVVSIAIFSGFSLGGSAIDKKYTSWEEVVKNGKNKTVTILMWGGNDNINRYMDEFASKNVKSLYGITLKRVPMDAPVFLTKLLNERKSNLNKGNADLLWINAENFRTAKDGGLLYGPFTSLLPNMNKYYDKNASDLHYDSGIPIDGYEGIWGRAQLVLTYDSAQIKNPPKSFKELLIWAKKNPGLFSYPRLPDDFAGTAFIRSAYYELTGKIDVFQKDMTRAVFNKLSIPVVNYFKELNKYLWHGGKSYPANQAQLDELFKSGELFMTMGFEIGKTSGLVQSGVYPKTVKTFVFDTGTIGNSHYLAVPFNSPNKAGALLVMDFLESPKAQIQKFDSKVWGDMPALDVNKLRAMDQKTLTSLEQGPATLSMKELTAHRLPEMKSKYIDWIKEIWTEQIGGK